MPRIVIDIDENMYQKIKGMENLVLKNRTFKSLELAVLEGKVLPEHHGRIADIDKAEKEIRSYIADNKDSEDLFLAGCGDGAYHALITLKCATIIPATKKDCRDCNNWKTCECGEKGHKNGTSMGFSIGECKDYIPATKEGDAE